MQNARIKALAEAIEALTFADMNELGLEAIASLSEIYRVSRREAPAVDPLLPTVEEIETSRMEKILAIKMYRERTGRCVAEAKDMIEAAMQSTYGRIR